jgi:hypothetical protein
MHYTIYKAIMHPTLIATFQRELASLFAYTTFYTLNQFQTLVRRQCKNSTNETENSRKEIKLSSPKINLLHPQEHKKVKTLC